MGSKEEINDNSYEAISGTAEEATKGMRSKPTDDRQPQEPSEVEGEGKRKVRHSK